MLSIFKPAPHRARLPEAELIRYTVVCVGKFSWGFSSGTRRTTLCVKTSPSPCRIWWSRAFRGGI